MASVGDILLEKDILLESGTNELEVLVFRVADFTFGINVAKVREVLPAMPITKLPKAHHSIRGVFKLRSNVIPCVSLIDYLGIKSTEENAESTMILADFNRQQTAFLVDAVERIHRLSWETILAVPPLLALARTPMTGVARCDGRLIVMLDFEMIVDQVTDHYFATGVVENPLGLPRENLRILLADDSPTVRKAITRTLRESGYTRLEVFDNGASAWKWIESRLKQSDNSADVADLIISDVEMPQMDGLHLTKRVKDHPRLKSIPVLLYSSIVTPDNFKKGAAVGANAQISKPDLDKVVQMADELIGKSRDNTLTARDPSVAAPSSSAPEPAREASAQPAPRPTPSTLTTSPRGGQPVSTREDRALLREFRQEVAGHAAALVRLLDAAGDAPGDGTLQEFSRVLHTIKAAAMVVPIDEVTHATHAVEEFLGQMRSERLRWPRAIIGQYAEWLATLASASDMSRVLADGAAIESELTKELALAVA